MIPYVVGVCRQPVCDNRPVRGEVVGRGVEIDVVAASLDSLEQDPATFGVVGRGEDREDHAVGSRKSPPLAGVAT